MNETRDLTDPVRPKGFGLPLSRRRLVIAAIAATGAGMALNWGWLTAIGAAPLILSFAPCAVMCAAGYCVMCKSKGHDAWKMPNDAANGWSD
ncbi:hypothetical protein [Cribrihabitans neustonicus]|uniref:hypothetical protein n=1 Tax=Cribrihabitans neustonicus TaxID=1429085 RepID=UPI003B5B5DA4